MKINLILAGIFVLALIGIVSAQSTYNCPMGGGMMYGMYGGYGSGMMVFSWVTYLLVIVLIIAAIYWLIKSANRRK